MQVTGWVCLLPEQGKEKEADAARKELSEGSKSDHIVLINAMKVQAARVTRSFVLIVDDDDDDDDIISDRDGGVSDDGFDAGRCECHWEQIVEDDDDDTVSDDDGAVDEYYDFRAGRSVYLEVQIVSFAGITSFLQVPWGSVCALNQQQQQWKQKQKKTPAGY